MQATGTNERVVVLAAGGTGGHVFPARALAEALQRRGVRPVLFTDRRGDAFGGLETVTIAGGGIAGLGIVARIKNIGRLVLGTRQALARLRQLRPAVVVGFGGYASLPPVLAASLLGMSTVIHEQNAVLGRANRMLARRVHRLAVGYETVTKVPAAARDKVLVTGMPVRPAFVAARDDAYVPPSSDGPVRILVLGGSQGARVFGEVIPGAIALLPHALRRRLVLTQQVRPEGLEAVIDTYRAMGITADLAAFFADIPERLAAAHLVIARSGASTVAEITVVGRPAILVPYPFATDDHQAANARALAAVGAAWSVPQPEFTPEALAAHLEALLTDPEGLTRTADNARQVGIADAADRLADVVLGLTDCPAPVALVAKRESCA